MKTNLLLIASAIVLATIGIIAIASSHDPLYPEVGLIADPIDLGNVESGRKIPFRIDLTNKSGTQASIVSISKSCGCAMVDSTESAKLPAYSHRTLNGTVDTRGKRGTTEIFVVIKYSIGDSNPRDLIVNITANVNPLITINPELPEFRVSDIQTQNITQTVMLSSVNHRPITIKDITSSTPWLKARDRSQGKYDKSATQNTAQAEIDIEIDTSMYKLDPWSKKKTAQWVRLQTDFEADPVVFIPVSIVTAL